MKTDQTGQTPRLISVFAGRICHLVGFVMRQLNFYLLGFAMYFLVQFLAFTLTDIMLGKQVKKDLP